MLRESWRNRAGFALAAMGSAIGLAGLSVSLIWLPIKEAAAFIVVYLVSLYILVPVEYWNFRFWVER